MDQQTQLKSSPSRQVANRLPTAEHEPPGVDCFADDRDAMNDFAKYFNNSHLSDVTLVVGDESFPAHRLILAKGSEVFDRMLSQRWNGEKKELELVEDGACSKVFAAFLRFLYCNHVVLHHDNCLSLLILADKYNVNSLRKVCVDFAISDIIPHLSQREVFGVWFNYATKAFHQSLIRACMQAIASGFEEMISGEEWEKSWIALDRDQLLEILKFNDLVLSNEYKLWEAVQRWLQAPNHSERKGSTAAPLIAQILPLIRFPLMTADELLLVEKSQLAENFPKLLHPQILLAYKYQALPLQSRAINKEFTGTQFLLRNYTDTRWDKQITVSKEQLADRINDHSFQLTTRASSHPFTSWSWSLKLSGQTYNTNSEDLLRMYLVSEDIDQPRSIEYLLCIVDEKKVLKTVPGKRAFTKTRYSHEIEIDKRIDISELLSENSSLLVDGNLRLQLILRPID